MAGQYNFTIDQGAIIKKTLYWYNVDKTLVDLTSYTASLVIYNPYTLTSILSLSSSGGSPGIVLGGSAGTIAVTITAAQSVLLTFDFARYYLKMTYSTTIVRFLLEGWITNRRH